MKPLRLLHIRRSVAPGNPSGPPVLLVHSFPSDSEADWGGWTETLAALGRVVCRVDLPGHGAGATPADASQATTSRIVDELDRVIRDLGGSADVVGYSLGARLSWELPRRGHVRRLVLGGIAPVDPFATVDAKELERFVADGTAPRDAKTARLAAMISRPGLNTAGLARCIVGLASEPFAPMPQTAPDVPTLFVVGEDDAMMRNGLEGVIATVADARLVTVPGDHRGALLSRQFRDAAIGFLTSRSAD
ncbi:MAG: 2-succinyl-6-hydroxy-2,4-cyclohexadiene-1-carboxylate synthase [Burkholderiaceae bacterium]|nr:2-succinyl-6-hydroxy-2,4-cyclohexadiene-1-carboxylate synthase [Burkholderiaceae bacterium]